jgi:CBS domain-containing protein
MREQDIGDVLVVDDDRLQGIVTDRDIVASRRPPAPLATAGRSAAPDTTGGSHRRQRERLEGLAAAGPEMTALAGVVRSFAALLSPSTTTMGAPRA